MGNYIGYAYHLHFKSNTPALVLDTLRCVMGVNPELTFEEMLAGQDPATIQTLENIHSSIIGASEIFKLWCTRSLTQTDTGWLFESKASTKTLLDDTQLALFFQWFMDYLDLEEGDILCRMIVEDGGRETIYVYAALDAGPQIYRTEGYLYDEYDTSHPTLQKHSSDLFDPSWDFLELSKEIDKKKQAIQDRIDGERYGF